MSLLDELLGRIFWNGAPLTRRGRMNFLGTAVSSIVDNEETGATDITISGPMGTLPEPGADGQVLTSDGAAWASEAIPTAAPISVTKAMNAAGTSSSFSRSDHKHDVTTAAASTIGTANSEGSATSLARSDHVHDHGDQPGGTLHALATTEAAGFFSPEEKAKLAGLDPSGASSMPVSLALGFDFQAQGVCAIENARLLPELDDWTGIISAVWNSGTWDLTQTASGESALLSPVPASTLGRQRFYMCFHQREATIVCLSIGESQCRAWFDLATGLRGSSSGTAYLNHGMEAAGDGYWWCWVEADSAGGLRCGVSVCDADASLYWSGSEDIAVTVAATRAGVPGVMLWQPRIRSISSTGARRSALAVQTAAPYQQPLLDTNPFTPGVGAGGAVFKGYGGPQGQQRYLDLVEPGGGYDLVRELSAAGAPWAFYCVATPPEIEDELLRPVFALTTTTAPGAVQRYQIAGFCDGNWVLAAREAAAAEVRASLPHGGGGRTLFAAYYAGDALIVRVGAALSTTTYQRHDATLFDTATLGGFPGGVGLQQAQSTCSLYQSFWSFRHVPVGGTLDQAHIAWLTAKYGL